MPNYQNAKIYTIRSHQTEQIYIGSTTQPLAKRLGLHKYMRYSSKEIMKYDDAYIELLEEFPCENKEQLFKREGHHIRSNDCVNKRVEGRTKKEYIQDNKEVIRERKKQYQETNKDKISEYTKQYRENNKDKISEYMKQYQETNKDKIKECQENKKDIRICVCGGKYNYGNTTKRKRHYASKKHQAFTEDFKIMLQEYLS